MRGRVTVLLLVVGGLVVGGLLLTLLQRSRATQALVYSVNNVRELSQFALLGGTDPAKGPPAGKLNFPDDPRFVATPRERFAEWNVAAAVPAGTVVRPELPPERRLSWVAPLLPTFNPKRQDTLAVYGQLDLTKAWDAGPNRAAAETPLRLLVSYAAPPPATPGAPAVTQFVGVGGLGADAPTLPLGPDSVADPRAGCFRYGGPTPFAAVADGLSNTVLIGEVSTDLGPWLQGGPATVRTFDPSAGAPVPVGVGGQFGGNHLAGGIFGMADHGVRVLTRRTDARFLANLCTINGGDAAPLPGE